MAIRLTDPGSVPHRWRWAIAFTPALLAVHWYLHQLGAPLAFSTGFTLLGLFPAIAAGFFLGRTPAQLGTGIGNLRAGSVFLLVGIPVAVAAAYAGAASPEIAAAYPLDPDVGRALAAFLPHVLLYGLYYAGFEFFFRGFLLFGLSHRLGPGAANLLQAGLATMVHFGKPDMEMAAAFPASLAFGWVTLRTGSIWYAFAIHWVVGVVVDWLLLG